MRVWKHREKVVQGSVHMTTEPWQQLSSFLRTRGTEGGTKDTQLVSTLQSEPARLWMPTLLRAGGAMAGPLPAEVRATQRHWLKTEWPLGKETDLANKRNEV